ncbi:MAG: GNAT family N-acetyltransferase [bacterium]
MSVVVEPPTFNDTNAIADLFFEDMKHLGVDVPLPKMQALAAEVVADFHNNGRGLLWVARMGPGEVPVGVILGMKSWSLKFAGTSVWIEELFVSPSARRNGVGRLLVDALLDWAEEHQVDGVDLEAYQGNTPASILYHRSIGFRRLGRERFCLELGSGR